METKHTPWPWSATCTRLNGKAVGFHTTSGMPAIRPVCEHYDAYGQLSAGEIEANANLIAAAPELLEALNDAMVLIDALMPGVRHIPLQDYAALNNTPIKARAAIAKATGK